MIVKIENVSKKIRGISVLENITMNLQSGIVTGFRGVNGSGKTMLMRLIAGLIYPTHGQVIVDGKVIGKDISFPDRIGFLIENPSFLDDYSAKDNLKMLASIKDIVTPSEIEVILKKVGLEDAAQKPYKKYSLGMKQRLGIAAAFLEDPEIILLDEPTNALDYDGIEMLQTLIKENDQKLIVITCHDQNILESLCDEIYSLKEGSIIDYRKLNGEK